MPDWMEEKAGDLAGEAADPKNLPPSIDDRDNSIASSWLYNLVGSSAKYGQPAERPPISDRKYPDPSVIEQALKYKSGSDSGVDAYIQKKANIGTETAKLVPMVVNNGLKFNRTEPIDDAVATQIAQGEAASHKSGLAKLGFDPSRVTTSPDSNKFPLTIGGAYIPYTDQIWYDRETPSSVTHESLHRGIERLINSPEYKDKSLNYTNDKLSDRKRQELLVRSLMSRYFGNVEYGRGDAGNKQIKEARQTIGKVELDELEDAAARLYARQRPGGPR